MAQATVPGVRVCGAHAALTSHVWRMRSIGGLTNAVTIAKNVIRS
jgi:hypothetical protein